QDLAGQPGAPGVVQAEHGEPGDALPGTGLADDTEGAAAFHGERDAVDRPDHTLLGTEGHGEVPHHQVRPARPPVRLVLGPAAGTALRAVGTPIGRWHRAPPVRPGSRRWPAAPGGRGGTLASASGLPVIWLPDTFSPSIDYVNVSPQDCTGVNGCTDR